MCVLYFCKVCFWENTFIYSALPIEHSAVKDVVLKAYKQVPEASKVYKLVLCDNQKSVIIAVINIIVIVIIKFFIIVIGNCSEFTVKILSLVEKYDIKVGVLT